MANNELTQKDEDGDLHQLEIRMVENSRKHRQQMRDIRNAAVALANEHPELFSVRLGDNERMLFVQASTEFDVDFEEGPETLILALGITAWVNGTLECDVNIMPPKGHRLADDIISYRLDMTQGPEANADLDKHLKGAQDDQKSEVYRSLMRAFAEEIFDREDDGTVTMIIDSYAETTIEADMALWIIQNAKNLRRPARAGYGPTLKDYQDYINQQEASQQSPKSLPPLLLK